MEINLEDIKRTKTGKLCYLLSILLLTYLYKTFLEGVGLWRLNSVSELLLFILSLCVFVSHIFIISALEKELPRFDILRVLIKNRGCVLSKDLEDMLDGGNMLLIGFGIVDISILIMWGLLQCMI